MMEKSYSYVAENIKRIKDDMYESAIKAGRKPEDITLLAASKTVDSDKINFALNNGINCIGENRVQELISKYDELEKDKCDIHFIGKLQTNKIKYIADKVSLIHSVDSVSQVKELSKRLAKTDNKMKVLIEVNIGDEASKSGVRKDELFSFAEEICEFSNIELAGLMCIPPICEKNAQICKFFSQMYNYYVDIRAKKLDNSNIHILSMGMSDDFKEAIECGSNLIRVGSAIFGHRQYN